MPLRGWRRRARQMPLGCMRAEAIALSGAMLKESASTFWNNGQWQMRVVDEAGEKVCALNFSADRS